MTESAGWSDILPLINFGVYCIHKANGVLLSFLTQFPIPRSIQRKIALLIPVGGKT